MNPHKAIIVYKRFELSAKIVIFPMEVKLETPVNPVAMVDVKINSPNPEAISLSSHHHGKELGVSDHVFQSETTLMAISITANILTVN